MVTNPFKPSAGATPPQLVGRSQLIDAFGDSLDEGPGSPGRLTIFTGARGVGKTVMLNEAEEVARLRGWFTINETATPGLIARLDQHVARLEADLDPAPRRRVTGVSLPLNLGGFTVEPTATLSVSLRTRLNRVLDLSASNGSGLLVTVDEVHSGSRPDLRELGPIAQHLIREDRQFAVVMAGLPSAVSSLLNDDVLTFLRRADKHTLAAVSIDDVQDALVETFRRNGRDIGVEASLAAAEATGGYPFLIQLVGYHVWRSTTARRIESAHVETGVLAARRRLGSLVHETALGDLSDVDRTFLAAMSLDDGASRMADVNRRMNIAPQYGNTYRVRLIEAGMIESVRHGRVDFTLPYLRDYLREHSAGLGLALGSSGRTASDKRSLIERDS